MLIITVNADESRRRTFSSFVENNSQHCTMDVIPIADVKNRNTPRESSRAMYNREIIILDVIFVSDLVLFNNQS